MIESDLFQHNRLLKDVTTFGIGGLADYYIEVKDITTMQALLPYCYQHHLPYFILGKGSNVLFDDLGFKGVVIANRINFLHQPAEDLWHVGGGYSFSLLGSQTARHGWSGLEFASGIPGSVGGAIFMNAGANGSETCETLVSVDYVDANGKLCCFSINELEFNYRYSSFQKHNGAIVGATFRLTKSNEARQKQLDIIQYRKKTQPYDAKSAGCVFRNPSSNYAGALIEKSGLKSKKIGGAQVSSLHANFILNVGKASSQDILDLIAFIQKDVKAKTGFELEHEIRYIPHLLYRE